MRTAAVVLGVLALSFLERFVWYGMRASLVPFLMEDPAAGGLGPAPPDTRIRRSGTMRGLWSLLTFLAGLVGALLLLANLEKLGLVDRSAPTLVGLLMGFVFVALAWKALQMARGQGR